MLEIRIGEADWRPNAGNRVTVALHLQCKFASDCLGICEGLLDRIDRTDGNAGFLECVQQVIPCP